MKRYLSEDGISMLFVLSALIVTGFIGGSLVKISGSDKVGQTFYKGSAAARSAAKSGMIAALAEIQTSDPTKRAAMIARLQTWIDTPNNAAIDPTDKWIVGGPNSGDFEALSSNLSYRAELLAFDTSNFTVTLRADGRKTGGGSATYLGTYRLDGLMFDQKEAEVPTNALYLGSGADEINRAIHVYGDTYMESTGKFLDNIGQQFEFHGDFYLENDNSSDYFDIKSTTFHKKVYLDAFANISKHTGSGYDGNVCEFKYGLGIGKHIEVWADAVFEIDSLGLYANGSIGVVNEGEQISFGDACTAKVNIGQTYDKSKTNPDYLPQKILDIDSDKIVGQTFVDVPKELGINKPPQVFVNMDSVLAKAITIGTNSGTIQTGYSNCTADYLNELYDGTSGGLNSDDYYFDSLGVKWLVLKFHTQDEGIVNTSGKFRGKVIWILDRVVDFNGDFYSHQFKADYDASTPEADKVEGLSMIYVTHRGQLNNFYSGDSFRGFIYSESKKQGNVFKATSGSSLHGGIYQQNGTGGKFRVEGIPLRNSYNQIVMGTNGLPLIYPGIFTVRFDQTVMDELKPLGIFVPEPTNDTKLLQLQTNRTNIAANHLSAIM